MISQKHLSLTLQSSPVSKPLSQVSQSSLTQSQLLSLTHISPLQWLPQRLPVLSKTPLKPWSGHHLCFRLHSTSVCTLYCVCHSPGTLYTFMPLFPWLSSKNKVSGISNDNCVWQVFSSEVSNFHNFCIYIKFMLKEMWSSLKNISANIPFFPNHQHQLA